jgi:hypothetical protein
MRLRDPSKSARRVELPTETIEAYSARPPSSVAAEIANLRERHDNGELSDTDHAVEVAQLVQGASGRGYDPTWLNELLASQTHDT